MKSIRTQLVYLLLTTLSFSIFAMDEQKVNDSEKNIIKKRKRDLIDESVDESDAAFNSKRLKVDFNELEQNDIVNLENSNIAELKSFAAKAVANALPSYTKLDRQKINLLPEELKLLIDYYTYRYNSNIPWSVSNEDVNKLFVQNLIRTKQSTGGEKFDFDEKGSYCAINNLSTMNIWCFQTNSEIKCIELEYDWCESKFFEDYVALFFSDSVKLFNLKSDELIDLLENYNESEDCKIVALTNKTKDEFIIASYNVVNKKTTIQLFNLKTGEKTYLANIYIKPTELEIAKNGNYLLIKASENLQILNLISGRTIFDCKAKWEDMAKGELTHSYLAEPKYFWQLSADGKFLISFITKHDRKNPKSCLKIWSLGTKEELTGVPEWCYSIATFIDSKGLNNVLMGFDKEIVIFDTSNNTFKNINSDNQEDEFFSHPNSINKMKISLDNKLLIALKDILKLAKIWKLDSLDQNITIKNVSDITISSDSKLIATIIGDDVVQVFDAETLQCLQTIDNLNIAKNICGCRLEVRISKDNRSIIVINRDRDLIKTIKLNVDLQQIIDK